MVTVKKYLYVNFAGDPNDETEPLKTDITPWLLDDGSMGIATRRGRQQITTKFNPGTGTFLLHNGELLFDDLNVDGPFTGQLVPMKFVQYGMERPWLPGLVHDGALHDPATVTAWGHTNCSATYVLGITPLDYGYIHAVNTAAATSGLLSPAVAVPAAEIGQEVAWSVKIWNDGIARSYTGLVHFYSDPAGTALISSSSDTNFPDANTKLFRLGSGATIPATTQSMRLEITHNDTNAIGDSWYISQIIMDFATVSGLTPHYTGYADGWDCSGDVGDDVCLLSCTDGFKSLGFTPMSSPLYGDYLKTLNATRWYRLGERSDHADRSTAAKVRMKEEISGELIGKIGLFNYGSQDYLDSETDGVLAQGLGPLFGVAGSSPLDNDLAWSCIGPSSTDSGILDLGSVMNPTGPTFSYMWWMRCTTGVPPAGPVDCVWGRKRQQFNYFLLYGNFQVLMHEIGVTGAGKLSFQYWGDQIDTGGPSTTHFGLAPATIQTAWFVDAKFHQFTFTYDASINTGLVYVDGVLDTTMTTVVSGGGIGQNPATFFVSDRGQVTDDAFRIGSSDDGLGTGTPPLVAPLEFDEFMFFDGRILTPTEISDAYINSRIEWAAEPSDDRVNRAADLIGWPASKRSPNTHSGRTMASVIKPFYQDNPLQYMQQVEDSEQGMLYIGREGNIDFWTRRDILENNSAMWDPIFIFGNGPTGEISYESVGRSNNDKILYTDAQVTREGGVIQIVDRNTDKFRTRSITLGNVLVPTDSDAYDIATFLAALYSSPGTQLTNMIINPFASEDHYNAVDVLEIGDMVTIRLRPKGIGGFIAGTYGYGTYGGGTYGGEVAGGVYYSVNAAIQGISHNGQRGNGRFIYDLSTIYGYHWMRFGDDFDSFNMSL